MERKLKMTLVRGIALIAAVSAVPFAVKQSGAIAEGVTAAAEIAEREIRSETSMVRKISVGNGSLMLYEPVSSSSTTQNENVNIIKPSEDGTLTLALDGLSERGTLPVGKEFLPSEASAEENEADFAELLIKQNISEEREDLTVYNSVDGEIYNTTVTSNEGTDYINLSTAGQVRNCTDIDRDTVYAETEKLPQFNIELNSAPQVLIMHTHTTESYEPNSDGVFDTEYNCRTLDPTKSVVAVGERIAQQLAEAGIAVLHDGTVHDSPEYSGAYVRSEQTVKEILAQYPSIKAVFDIHRDAVEEADGSRTALISQVDGREAAQVMIIAAADDGTYGIPQFMQNLRFAALIQGQAAGDYEGLMRPVLFQYCQYNQHLTTGSLLIEVGSHGNSLEQALYAGELLGRSIARALISLS